MDTGPTLPTGSRSRPSAPAVNTERRAPFANARHWTDRELEIFDHTVSIDVLTGNVSVSTWDVRYPFHGSSLGIAREYDLQEQHTQLRYIRSHPNVDPDLSLFANWRFGYEASVQEVWRQALPELHIRSYMAGTRLFESRPEPFKIHTKNRPWTERQLKSYGVSGRTLDAIGWSYLTDDFLFRTTRGPFQIATGRYYPKTFVDDTQADIWIFDPILGNALMITSAFGFNAPDGNIRSIGPPLLINKDETASAAQGLLATFLAQYDLER